MSFDLSLARGLDYYTGIIYEVVTAESAPPGFLPSALEGTPSADASAAGSAPGNTAAQSNGTPKEASAEDEDAKVGVGSIAAGGRYDNLVAMFSPSGTQIPCVGISFGVERIFSILWKRQLASMGSKDNIKSKEVDVFVMAVGDGLLTERMQIAKELWDAGLRVSAWSLESCCSSVDADFGFCWAVSQTEFMYKAKPKAAKQFEAIDKDQIPFAVIIGANELKDGKVRVKEQMGKDAVVEDKDGRLMERSEMVQFIKSRMAGRTV